MIKNLNLKCIYKRFKIIFYIIIYKELLFLFIIIILLAKNKIKNYK